MSKRTKTEHKNFSGSETEVRTFNHGRIELMNVNGSLIGRGIFEPGWKWSKDVKPIAKTQLCKAPHFLYSISGRMHVRMEDGKEFELGPGDVAYIPEGHDAWVVGNERVVNVDWVSYGEYAKQI